MKRKAKKLMCILAASVMLAGCGSEGGTGQNSDSASEQGTVEQKSETKSQESVSNSSEKQIEITWLNHNQEEGKQIWMNGVVENFEAQNPNIKVNLETVGADNYTTMLQTKIASGDAPAVFDLYNADDVKLYDENGYLCELNDLESIKALDEDILAVGKIGDRQMCVVSETCAMGIFYNVDVFEKLSLSEPQTISELITVCETLQENGIAPFAAPCLEFWAFKHYPKHVVEQICLGKDRTWYKDKMDLTSNFSDDEDFKKAMSIFSTFRKYWSEDAFGTSWDTAQNMVANGEAAMVAHGSWAVEAIMSKNPDCRIGFFPMPISETAGEAKVIKEANGGYACYKFEDEEVQAAALKLIDYILSAESAKSYAEDAKQMPTVPGDYDVVDVINELINYPAEETLWTSGCPQFTKEYADNYYEAISAAAMNGEEIDIDALCAEIDKRFSTIE